MRILTLLTITFALNLSFAQEDNIFQPLDVFQLEYAGDPQTS